MIEATIEDILDKIRNFEQSDRKALLFIGAGCSVSAGIPLARVIIKDIEEKYPRVFEKAVKKDYMNCMKGLDPGDRRKLINAYIKDSKINWAHLAIAQLMQNGHVDRILTTNFDPILIKACALVGEFPAIYDMAVTETYKPGIVHDKAIFYLQGQYNGFLQQHTELQNKNNKTIPEILRRECEDRVVIVVGYSGESDPILDQLSKIERQFSLFWICYEKNEPGDDVCKNLLKEDNYAYKIKGYNADSFFIKLAQELKCFPPLFAHKPYSYLKERFAKITTYKAPDRKENTDNKESLVDRALEDLEISISRFEEGKTPKQKTGTDKAKQENTTLINEAMKEQMAGNHEKVIELISDELAGNNAEAADIKVRSLLEIGDDLGEKALLSEGKEADELFEQAYIKYQKSLKIQPDFHEVFYNWGVTLTDQAETKEGDDAVRLYELACEMYENALKLDPHDYETLGNLGNALSEHGRIVKGDEADRIFELASIKYEEALLINPDNYDVMSNWGNALYERARINEGQKAEHLYTLACEKYEKANKINPDEGSALINWGNALVQLAKTKDCVDAEKLYERAFEKYEMALKINPEDYDALDVYGMALMDFSRSQHDCEKEKYLKMAEDKYLLAEKNEPGISSYDLSCIAALRGKDVDCEKWLNISKEKETLPSKSHIENDEDLKSVKDTEWFKAFLAGLEK